MVTWQAFEAESGELAAFGRERLDRRVSFLATIRGDGGPRVHPVTPWIFNGHLYVRMFDTSPKVADLTRRSSLRPALDDGQRRRRSAGSSRSAVRPGWSRIRHSSTAAFSAVADFTDRPLVLFEFLFVDEVMTTMYSGDETERRRWRAASTG